MKKRINWFIGLLMLGLIYLPKLSFATPTTTLLITDRSNHRVIEVDANHNILYQYGQTGVYGTGTNQLNYPLEAVKLTNGNVLIADDYRVIEVQPTGTSGGTIVWDYRPVGFDPRDVKKLANGNVLIVEGRRVLEVTPVYPATATVVWQCGTGPNITLSGPYEAEWRPGTPTDYYLITDWGYNRVIEVQRTSPTDGTITWQYGDGTSGSGPNQLWNPADAMRLICGTILIVDESNNRVIEVQPTYPTGGTIVWECDSSTGLPLYSPYEAIRMSNWNTLIADTNNQRVIEVRTNDYPSFTSASIVWQQGQTGVWGTGTNQLNRPTDVEELGIVNIAKAEYQDATGKDMPREFAGIVVELRPPVVNLPEIELSKDVSYIGPVTIGATLTYTIGYNNVGTGTAHNVVITDMVPDGTEYVTGSAQETSGPTATESYSHDGGLNFDSSESVPVTHVRWTIPTVAPGEAGTLEFQVVIR